MVDSDPAVLPVVWPVMPDGPVRGWASGMGFRQPGRYGTGRCPVLRSGIRRRGRVAGGEGGFNLAQPPEVRPHLRREIDERGNRSIACTFLPGPAQGLPHLPAGDGES